MRLYEAPPLPVYTEEKCAIELERILNSSTKVGTLLRGIKALNKNSLERGVTCRPCKGTLQESQMGYYDGRYKRVVICCDNIKTRQDLEDTLIHELTHAFDSSRKGNFKSPCHLVACGEIRASAIGQCSKLESKKEKYKCIWNDAVKSTEIHCGLEKAEKAVNEMFEKCVHDETPF